jgi:hypothetical protein
LIAIKIKKYQLVIFLARYLLYLLTNKVEVQLRNVNSKIKNI